MVGKERCNIFPGGVHVFVEFYFRVYSRWLRWECSSCHYVVCDTAFYKRALARPVSSCCRFGWIVSPCSSPFAEAKLDFVWSNGVLHDVSPCMYHTSSRGGGGIRLLFLFLSRGMYSLETSVTHRRADIIDTVKLATVKWTRSVPLITVARNVYLILDGRALGNGLYKRPRRRC